MIIKIGVYYRHISGLFSSSLASHPLTLPFKMAGSHSLKEGTLTLSRLLLFEFSSSHGHGGCTFYLRLPLGYGSRS